MDDQFEEWWDKSEYDFMGFETSRGCARAAFKAGALAMRERAAKEVPTNWCDPMLTGKGAPNDLHCPSVEYVLNEILKAIRALPVSE